MKKALIMEKEAAFKLPQLDQKSFWPYAYFRSAAWMSLHLGLYSEAFNLVQFALAGSPSPFEKKRLNEIILTIKEKAPKILSTIAHQKNQVFSGFLVSIDLAKKKAVLQINEKPEYQYFRFSKELELAPLLLGQLVSIHVKKEADENVIQEIKLAA